MKKYGLKSAVMEKNRGFSLLLLTVAVASLFCTPLVNGNLVTDTTIFTTSTSAKTSTITFKQSSTTTFLTTTSTRFTTLTTVEPEAVIGFIGCSNTADSVLGYQAVTPASQVLFWNARMDANGTQYKIGDGIVTHWDDPTDRWWMNYTHELTIYGQPKIVWVQLCTGVDANTSFANVTTMLSILQTYSPGVIVYISPLNSFDGITCSITGPNGVQLATGFAQQAVSAGLALQGPIMGPLNSTTTISDHCHPNAEGQQILGQQLQQFFNNLSPTAVTMTVSYSVVGGGSPTPPVFNYVSEGMPQQYTLTTKPTVITVDTGSSWSITTNPLKGSTSSERWWTSQPTNGTASTSRTLVFQYNNQFKLTMNTNPSSGGSVTPGNKWENSSAPVNIQATPTSNYSFMSWTGTGLGSYTGANNPATIAMNGPITETANLHQGGELSVSLDSPLNGVTVTSSPITLNVTVGGSIHGATVTVFLDGSQICSGSTNSTGSFSCKHTLTKTGMTHSWYATAAKTGFTSGTSPTWTFKY